MIDTLLIFLLVGLLLPITLLHSYWLMGGQWALDACLPVDNAVIQQRYTTKLLMILRFVTLVPVIVILCLLLATLLSLHPILITYQLTSYLTISLLCILRAVLGWIVFPFFIKKQGFIINNATIFSPLFLLIGILFLYLYLLI